MTTQDYAIAGYNGMTSERPPYDSSIIGMAFRCGEICREHNLYPHEIKASRGYSFVVNRTYKIRFLADTRNRKGAYSFERIG